MDNLDISGKFNSGVVIGGKKRKQKTNKAPTTKPEPEPDLQPVEKSDDNIANITESDDNQQIISLLEDRTVSCEDQEDIISNINKRLNFGSRKYGHGIIINDDTKKYASDWDESSAQDWLAMAVEENCDQMVYFAAAIIKAKMDDESKEYIHKLEKCIKHSIKVAENIIEAKNLR